MLILVILALTLDLLTVTTEINALSDNNGDDSFNEEYCELETFRPQCLKNEVIVMENAVYGRRYRGRCLEAEEPELAQNPRYLGCSADVTSHLDAKCSGRKQCEIRIPDADLQQTRPCPKGVDMFLEVKYSCVEVVEEDRSCQVSVTSNPVHISRPNNSVVLANAGRLHCGTKSQPWLLEAPAGQRINISFLDFAPVNVDSSSYSTRNGNNGGCAQHHYGYIIDKSITTGTKRNVSLCSRQGSKRFNHVYLSTSNHIEIVFSSDFDWNSLSTFLIRIEAIGCSDLIPPDDAWLKRTDNEAIVGCYTSRQTWHLKCEDRRWIGVVSNCTAEETDIPLTHVRPARKIYQRGTSYRDFGPFPIPIFQEPSAQIYSTAKAEMNDFQVLIVVAVGVCGLAVCLVIICCGIYCLRRYSGKNELNGYKDFSDYNRIEVQRKVPNTTNSMATANSGQPTNGVLSLDPCKTPSAAACNNSTSAQYFVLDQSAVANS